jgi:TPR repeat protein
MRDLNRDREYAEADDLDADLDDQEDWEDLNRALSLSRLDPAAGLAAYLDLAETGSAQAMNAVGEAYYWGKGVAVDEAEGELWYRQAFKAGSKRALLNYGRALAHRGDLAGAEAVFREGAQVGWSSAMYWLATVSLDLGDTRQRRDEARALLERAAAMGHPMARWKLGRLMMKGFFGVRLIPRGFSTLVALAKDQVEAWNRRKATVARTTSSGEALH